MSDIDKKDTAGEEDYIAPAVEFDEELEVVAVSCMAPAKANPGACPAGPINS